MIILEKPYVSETLINYIISNDWLVLETETLNNAYFEDGIFNTISSEDATLKYSMTEYPAIYANSENAIDWVLKNLPESNLCKYINLFKNKIEFRKTLKDIYPDFYYKEVSLENLNKIPLEELQYPLVIKPAIGFLSKGVHVINNDLDWKRTITSISQELAEAESLFPKSVVNSSKLILEEYIDGEEFAIDAYYDNDGIPVILNIFQHPFLNSNDVRDRIYLMSAGIMMKYMSKFFILLKQIGDKNNIRNFPLHMEVRITSDEKILPIEVNPMRFAGWCTTDVAEYAWGINVYDCFINQIKPNWNEILSNAKKGVYYFSMAEVSPDINQSKIKAFDYEKFLSNFSNVLEVRRINPKTNPLFAIIFGKTENKEEIKNILQLKTKDFTKFL